MRKIIFIIMMLHVIRIAAQNDFSILIDGFIVAAKDKRPVSRAGVHLTTCKGSILKGETDSAGYYSFLLSDKSVVSGTISVGITRHTSKPTAASSYGSPLNTPHFLLNDTVSKNHFTFDFELQEVFDCSPAPQILFKKNSSVLDTIRRIDPHDEFLDLDAFVYPYEELKSLKLIFELNPNITVLLTGHCSADEKNVQQLSLQRAETVKTELAKMGVEKDRINTKGFGTSKLLIKTDVINKAKTQKEKNELCAKNRRCVMIATGYDYGKEQNHNK